MAEHIDITIPDLGDFEDVEVIEVLVSAGDKVALEDGLITLETDKASMDVPAPATGTIAELNVGVGDKVSSGSVIGRMEVDQNDTVPEKPVVEATAEPAVSGAATTVLVDPDDAPPKSAGEQTVAVAGYR